MMPLMFILENISVTEVGGGIVFLIVTIWAFKSGIPQQLFTTTNSLLEKRTTERDDALRERDIAKRDIEQLKEELITYRREVIQRMDINLQDQETIRKLRNQ